jgi:aminopeptidase N
MKWWDDLWLNEAFATFMAFLVQATSEATIEYHETTWVAFLEYKFWGIQADSMTSTHPVCANIADTDEAESLFDGISYGKGSAFVK